jgi:hypothetical protein
LTTFLTSELNSWITMGTMLLRNQWQCLKGSQLSDANGKIR